MHITIDKEKLTEHIQKLEKVTGKHLNLEVLKCILLDAQKDTLVLRATNLDIGIEVSMDVKVKETGTIAVPGATFSGFLEHTTSDTVDLSTKKETLTARAGKATVSINTISPDEFPTLPETKGDTLHVPAEMLLSGLKSVWYAASPSGMKPELSSILITGSGGELVFVATDSFRLAEKKIQHEDLGEIPSLLLPVKNVGELIRNLERTDAKTTIAVTASENQISFSFDETHITSRLVDGTFPDYQQIIPKEHTTEVVLLKQDLMQALKVTNVFANRFNQVTLSVDPPKKQFVLKTKGGEIGESTLTLDASLSGEETEVNFNQKYITDSFQSIEGDSVVLRLFGGTKPMVIKSTNDPSFLYLTMPMSR